MVRETEKDEEKNDAGTSACSRDTDDGTDSAGSGSGSDSKSDSDSDTTAGPTDVASPAIPVIPAATAQPPATTLVEDPEREEEVVYVPSEVVDVVVGVGGANVAYFERMSGRCDVRLSHRTSVP